MVLNGDFGLFKLTLNFLKLKKTVQTLIRRRFLQRLIRAYIVCQCPSPGFTDNLIYTALCRQSDKNGAAVSNRDLDFVQTNARFDSIGQW